MTSQNAAQFLPLVQALADGKTLQYRYLESNPWEDCTSLAFVGTPSLYRIKPDPIAPIEFDAWVSFYSNGSFTASASDMSEYSGWRKIRVREITNEQP